MQRKPRAASARTMAKLLMCGSSLLHSGASSLPSPLPYTSTCKSKIRSHCTGLILSNFRVRWHQFIKVCAAVLLRYSLLTSSLRSQSPCSSWPCQNNGTCVSPQGKNSYVCLCTKGFSGEYCQSLSNKVFYSYHIIEKVNIKRNSSHSFDTVKFPLFHFPFYDI